MPLNDDPLALTDEQYLAGMQEMADRAGDDGLHTIPEDVLSAALARAEARSGEDQ